MMKFFRCRTIKKDKKIEDTKNEILSPIIFKNTPIENDSQDVFDFKTQVDVLNAVEESGAKIIRVHDVKSAIDSLNVMNFLK